MQFSPSQRFDNTIPAWYDLIMDAEEIIELIKKEIAIFDKLASNAYISMEADSAYVYEIQAGTLESILIQIS